MMVEHKRWGIPKCSEVPFFFCLRDFHKTKKGYVGAVCDGVGTESAIYVYYYSGSKVLLSSIMTLMEDKARKHASDGYDLYVL